MEQKYDTIRIFYRIWKFPGYGNFSGYGRPGIKCVEIHVEIQDMEIFQDMKIIQNMEISLDR